jgi:hypothetical protein
LIQDEDNIYENSTSSPKKYGERIMDLVNEFSKTVD